MSNPLAGKPLRYLIGADGPVRGAANEIVEAPYGDEAHGDCVKIGYCNLFDEEMTGDYGPYLFTSDTAEKYGEGQIDPDGPGWDLNITEQLKTRKRQGFKIIEWDNPDAYEVKHVVSAVEKAAAMGFEVVAKNPGLLEGDPLPYVAHPAVVGIIVEKDAGDPAGMDALRRRANKPDLPVWFVAFGSGKAWAGKIAEQAAKFRGMGVTLSERGEYKTSKDVLLPK